MQRLRALKSAIESPPSALTVCADVLNSRWRSSSPDQLSIRLIVCMPCIATLCYIHSRRSFSRHSSLLPSNWFAPWLMYSQPSEQPINQTANAVNGSAKMNGVFLSRKDHSSSPAWQLLSVSYASEHTGHLQLLHCTFKTLCRETLKRKFFSWGVRLRDRLITTVT